MHEKQEDAREADSISEWGKCPGVANSSPLQYSCLANATDRGAWRTASQVGHAKELDMTEHKAI